VLLAGGAVVSAVTLVLIDKDRPAHPQTTFVPPPLMVVFAGSGFEVDAQIADRSAAYTFEIMNSSDRAIEVRYPGLHLPSGFRPMGPTPAPAVTLRPRQTTRLTIAVRVTDCSAVPKGDWPLVLQVRPTGTGPWTDDPILRPGVPPTGEWQLEIADSVCRNTP
jgi:hypothetical protein